MNWKFWKRQVKASRTESVIATGLWGGAAWTKADYDNFAKETYMKNLIAFACIDKIAKSVSSVDWKLYTRQGGEKTEVENHPFNNILYRTNPDMAFNYFNYEVTCYLVMSGNVYLEQVKPESGPNRSIPKELYTLRPSRMSIKVDENTGQKTYYVYEVNGQQILFPIDPVTGQSDILHLKFFNPLDDFYGMAITQPASREIDTSNSSMEWNKKLMDNSARPGMLLMFEKELTDKQFDRVKKDVQEGREGAQNAGKSLVLEGARDAKPFGFSPQEMDWINSNIELSRKICIAYGVPPQLIGIPDVSTYSNYQEARSAFWEDTIMFYLSFLKTEYNYWLFPEQDVFLGCDLENIPALQYKRDLKWERAQKSDFLTINEKRELAGFDPVDNGDVVLIPANLLPLGAEPETEDEINKQTDSVIDELLYGGFDLDSAALASGKNEYD